MIYFDHTFTADKGHKFHKKLKNLGFQLDPQRSEHPGQTFCKFIMIKQPGAPNQRIYLEFINSKTNPSFPPGLSFGYASNLEKFYKKVKADRRYKTIFEHRNYKWKEDSKSYLPGWNFLSFKSLHIPNPYIWMTEYETNPEKIGKKIKIPQHPNGVTHFYGFQFELNLRGKKFFSYLLGQKIKPEMKIKKCGTKFYIQQSRRNKMNAIILKCKNLNYFIKKYKINDTLLFQDQPAARIKNPSGWDNIII